MAENKLTKSKFRNFGVVINAPKESPQIMEDLRAYERAMTQLNDTLFVATIIHDKDTYTKEDEEANPNHKAGDHKLEHLHGFFILMEDKTPGQALKWLSGAIRCDKSQVSIEGSNSEVLLCQYLTHQNHPEKARYYIDEITTNNREKLENLLGKTYEKPLSQEEQMRDAIFNCQTLSELISQAGIIQANKYRATFNQVKEEQRAGARNLEKQLDDMTTEAEELYKMLKKLVSLTKKKAVLDRDIEEAEAIIRFYEAYYLKEI